MISKKIIFLSCVLLIFLSIGNISAIDVNNTIQSSNVNLNEVITSNEINEQDVLSISDENEIYGRGSSKDLQKLVDNAQGTLDLNDNYEFTGSSEAVKISKNITINGNDHTINGKRSTHMFSIEKDGISVVLKNIEFKDGKSDHGGAIFNNHENTNLTIINCTFNSNAVYKEKIIIQPGNGAAIYSHGKLTIINSKFHDNYHSLIIDELKDSHFVPKEINIGSDNGAIYCTGNLLVNNSYFSNNLAMSDGGAIYCTGNLLVNNSYFSNNLAMLDGGAIYCGGVCSIYNSKFENNHANNEHTSANYGGAIYSNRINTVNNCIFSKNKAYSNPLVIKSDKGGAIYISDKCNPEFVSCRFEKNFCEDGGAIYLNSKKSNLKLTDCSFIGNTAKYGGAVYSNGKIELSFCSFSHNSADVDGGAIYNSGVTIISNSKFVGNAATGATVKRSFGGAIRSEGFIDIEKSTFENNNAYNLGGAVYGDGETRIKNSTFMHNSAKEGGAVFAEIITEVANSQFIKNNATSGHGGALYINNGDTTLSSCIFEENTAPGKDSKGGGIYKDSSFLTIWNCEFYRNSAGQGGGVYTSKVTSITYSYFIGNKATAQKGDGGGVYVNNECNFNTYSCRYEDNEANNRGGAIYTDSNNLGSKIGIDYCTFVHNKAKQKDYTPNGNRLPGHSVFHSGYYKYVNLCWFGKNDPDTTNQIVEYHTKGSDDNYIPTNNLRVDMKAENMKPLVGNPYTVTIYFSGNGLNLNKWNLYHSDAKFGSTYVEFSNIKTKVNDITATYVAKRAGTGVNIHGYFDDQYLVLNLYGVNKDPSEVEILTCEDVKYPNALNVTYKINPMSESKYVIKDAQNKTVKTGSLTNPNSVYIEGLTPGSYSITISNTETWNNLAGSDTKTFTVNRGDIEQLRVVVYNKTYPEDVDCTVYASVDGEYNLTISDVAKAVTVRNSAVTVRNGVGFINFGTLDNNTYEAVVKFTGNEFYATSSNTTTFVVYPQGTGTFFAVSLNASVIDYLQTAIISHELSKDATGNITYYLGNGTFLGKLPVNENFTLPILNAGYYVIIANYSGDKYHNSVIDIADLIINKIDSGFSGVIINESGEVDASVDYNQNAIVSNSIHENATGTITYYLSDGTILGQTPVCNNFTLPKLGVGVYSIRANYSGDRNFNPANDSFPLHVYRLSATFNIDLPYLNPYGQNINVTHYLPDGAQGSIKYFLTADDIYPDLLIFIGEVSVGENFTLSAFDVGEYNIQGFYSGDNIYESAVSSKKFCVEAIEPEFSLNITANVTEYGETPTVLPILSSVDGNITYYLSDGTFLGNSLAVNNFTLPVLDARTYLIIGNYSGSKNYRSVTANITLTVNKAQPVFEIYVNASEIEYNQSNFVSHVLSENATGRIKYYLNNVTLLDELPVGENLTLPILDAGNYIIVANYSGDINFKSSTDYLSFTIYPAVNNVVLNVSDVTYRENTTIKVSADVDGNYQLDVNGIIYNVTVNNGFGSKTISLNAGSYYANASFTDSNYNTVSKNANFNVYKAVNNLDIVIFDTVYPNDVSGVIYAEVDGEYKLTIGEYSTNVVVKNDKGEFNAGILDAGEYLVVVNYPGDLNYEANSYSTNVTVGKFVPNIKLHVLDIDYGDVGVITITSDIPGSVNVTVNGITEILDLNGQSKDLLMASMNNVLKGEYQATLRLNNMDAGLYPVTVVYNGDENIESIELSADFNVNALNVTMDINANDINVGDDEVITVILSSDVNGTVTVVVDDMNYSTSVSDGKAVITIPGLAAGYKNANVYYSGDANHNSVLGNVSFAVNKLNPVMSVESNTSVSGENIHIVVYLPSDATGTVTLALEGKYYTAQVKDGKAVFDIPGLAAGKYNITAYYSGDDKYDPAQIDSIITVNDNSTKEKNQTEPYNKLSSSSNKAVKATDNAAGNPILMLLLTLMAIGFTGIRRF